jgi:pilus assembly protein Flp/PilA
MIENLRTFIDSLRERRALRDEERGASAVEYGLLVAGIAALVVTIVFALGGTIETAFDKTEDCVSKNGAADCGATP